MTEDHLPRIYLRMRQLYPGLTEALDGLGRAADEAGPLDERTQQLVKLGIAMGAQAEGAVRSHARRALDAGSSPEELRHVVALTVATRGYPAAVAAFSWLEEVLGGRE